MLTLLHVVKKVIGYGDIKFGALGCKVTIKKEVIWYRLFKVFTSRMSQVRLEPHELAR